MDLPRTPENDASQRHYRTILWWSVAILMHWIIEKAISCHFLCIICQIMTDLLVKTLRISLRRKKVGLMFLLKKSISCINAHAYTDMNPDVGKTGVCCY